MVKQQIIKGERAVGWRERNMKLNWEGDPGFGTSHTSSEEEKGTWTRVDPQNYRIDSYIPTSKQPLLLSAWSLQKRSDWKSKINKGLKD